MELMVIIPIYLIVTILLIWLGWKLGARLPFTGLKRWIARISVSVLLVFPLYQEFFIVPLIYNYICGDIDLSDMVQEKQSVPMLYIGDDDGSCEERCRNGLFKYNLPAVVGADTRWKEGNKISDTRWKFEAVACSTPGESQCIKKTDVTNIPFEDRHWYADDVVQVLSNPGDFFRITRESDLNRQTSQVLRARQRVEFIYPAISNYIIRLQFREAYRKCESPLYSTYPEAEYSSL